MINMCICCKGNGRGCVYVDRCVEGASCPFYSEFDFVKLYRNGCLVIGRSISTMYAHNCNEGHFWEVVIYRPIHVFLGIGVCLEGL